MSPDIYLRWTSGPILIEKKYLKAVRAGPWPHQYDEKATRAGKLKKAIAAHRKKRAKSCEFRRLFRHRNKQLTLV
jgi:hypothetical protein